MALTPAVSVQAPEPRGIRYGLFTAAAGPLDLPDHGRAGGIQYEPVSCGVAHLYPVDCPPGDVKVFDDGEDVVQADPFVVYATLVCGSVGNTHAELEAKVRRRLTNGEQGVAELALSNILDAAATPTVDVGDPADIVATVAELEQWLYGTSGYGNVGVLHAPVRVAAYAAAQGLIVQDGRLKRTPYGTVWSIGGGYSGTMPGGVDADPAAPGGGLYITGHTTVWRSPDIFVSPAVQVFNRATNQYHLVAEREYVIAYDCLAAGAPVEESP